MHIYTLCASILQSFTKFCWAVSEELRWQTVSVVSFILVKFQKGRHSEIKDFLWICTSTHYVLHYYIFSRNSVKRFQRSCADKLFWVVSLILAKFLSSKRASFRERKKLIRISFGYAHLHGMSFTNTKFHEICERFQRSCAYKLFQKYLSFWSNF